MIRGETTTTTTPYPTRWGRQGNNIENKKRVMIITFISLGLLRELGQVNLGLSLLLRGHCCCIIESEKKKKKTKLLRKCAIM